MEKKSAVDFAADIAAFHEKFELEYKGKPRILPGDLAQFRMGFIQEEFSEYHGSLVGAANSIVEGDPEGVQVYLEKALDALVDLVYVIMGTSYLHGFDFNEAWRRVHQANMAKIKTPSASMSKRDSPYDVIKPEGWVAPDLSDLVEDHRYRGWE